MSAEIPSAQDWALTPANRPLKERLRAFPDEVWRQRGLLLIVPAILTLAYAGLLEELHLEGRDLAAIFCRLSVYYLCMAMAVCIGRAFIPDHYRSGPGSSGPVLVALHTGITAVGVVVGAEIAAGLLRAAGGTEELSQGRALVYGLGFMIGLLVQAMGFMIDNMEYRAREGRLRVELAKRDALQARLDALQARTHPHFLFNSLNVIAELVAVNADRAETAIETLSDLMRYAIHGARERNVPLTEEFRAVENYLALERLRYGDRLRVVIEIDPEARSLRIPPFCLQPIAENAVLHGISTREAGGQLRIRASVERGRLQLSVEDDGAGPGASSHSGSGTAMADLESRLALLYGGRARLSTTEPAEGGYRVDLELPIEEEEAGGA